MRSWADVGIQVSPSTCAPARRTLKSLRRFKDEVREVQQGYECGMALDGYQDLRIGDRIQCYQVQEITCSL